ncbi:MAG TPA: aldehyde dehydrogenase [Brumimicrobium sp.]|nr:aldehyde dehydrogenase [Brumimicrobium sp.]
MEQLQIEELVKAQNTFFNTNSTKEIKFRVNMLKKLKSALKENEEQMYKAIHNDFKKSTFDTLTNELALVYLDIDEAVSKVQKWSKRKRVKTNLLNFPAKSYIYPEPLGTCLVIGAWNYPIQLSFAPVVAAIAAGNTIVLKPSEVPSETSNIIAEIVNSNFKKEFFHAVEGGVEITTSLLALKWDKIFFTGSTKVGKIVYQAAAKHLTPVTLELGGKSPAFVSKNCNLDVAVKRIVWGKFLNAGQTCIAPDYILVESSIQDEFLKKLKERIIEMDFAFKNDNYVQIINDGNYKRLKGMINQSKVYYTGEYDEASRYFPPVLMKDVSFSDKIMEDEIFGPILPVIPYDDLSWAINQVKKHPKPLACYVFSNESSYQTRIIDEISFGGGAVNDTIMHIANSHLPFGGVGTSGIGSYHGKAGFDTFTHHKSILDKATWLDPSVKYPPYSPKKLKLIRWIMGV